MAGVVWTVALLGAGWVLVEVGHGPLALPRSVGGPSLERWVAARDAATIVMAAARALSLALDAYLLLATLVGATARATGSPRVVRAVDALTPASVRRVLTMAMGGLVLSAPLVARPPPAAWLATQGPATPSTQRPPPLSRAGGVVVLVPVSQGPPLVRLDGGTSAQPRAGPPSAEPRAAPPSAQPRAAPPATLPRGRREVAAAAGAPSQVPVPLAWGTWTVRPGDNFWCIARSVLERRLGSPVTPSQVAPFWRALIAANRDRLRTGDPHWVYPLQVFVIPPR
jgi:nucleoid-associated protein YgaU